MYKYSCRKCPIRNRCIDESNNSPIVKENIRHAFGARTDTRETWGLLQPNCLLLKAEQERARMAPEESMLGRRLRQARQAKEQGAGAPSTPSDQQPDKLRPVSSPVSPQVRRPPKEARPDSVGARDKALEAPRRERPQPQDRVPSAPCWLTVLASRRHISLPTTGQLVLGRFDPNFGIPPDIDLAYEDRGTNSVSRQHAKITGVDGRHTIEGLSGRHELFLNEERVRSGTSRQLRLGDRIALGNVELLYDTVPRYLLDLPPTAEARHVFTVTPTGRRVTVAPPNDVIIGRSDPYIDFVPDIDLSREGDVAVRVSRRHAIITWRNDKPYLEDLGSGFGTRLNGETLLLGQAVPLKPGDHIWLGGCMLAYDVEL